MKDGKVKKMVGFQPSLKVWDFGGNGMAWPIKTMKHEGSFTRYLFLWVDVVQKGTCGAHR